MIIDRIRIKNLYGQNYDIKLKPDISFLYGENGCGKTVVLKAINSVLSGNYSFLHEADVEEVIIDIYKDINDKSSDCIYIGKEDISNNVFKLKKYVGEGESSSVFISEENDSIKAEYVRRKMNAAFEDKNNASKATSIMKIINEILSDRALFICGLVNHDLCFSSGDTIFSISKAGSGMIQLMYILTKLFLDGGGNSTVYLIDNPETHLHPDLQSCIVDAIMSYSDNQLIIATHAPEIIGALRDNMVNVSGTRHSK